MIFKQKDETTFLDDRRSIPLGCPSILTSHSSTQIPNREESTTESVVETVVDVEEELRSRTV